MSHTQPYPLLQISGRYIPVLCSMARIYWDRENYAMVEKIFRQSAEFCSEHETWKLNVAHMFFMQETKFKEAIRYSTTRSSSSRISGSYSLQRLQAATMSPL